MQIRFNGTIHQTWTIDFNINTVYTYQVLPVPVMFIRVNFTESAVRIWVLCVRSKFWTMQDYSKERRVNEAITFFFACVSENLLTS